MKTMTETMDTASRTLIKDGHVGIWQAEFRFSTLSLFLLADFGEVQPMPSVSYLCVAAHHLGSFRSNSVLSDKLYLHCGDTLILASSSPG